LRAPGGRKLPKILSCFFARRRRSWGRSPKRVSTGPGRGKSPPSLSAPRRPLGSPHSAGDRRFIHAPARALNTRATGGQSGGMDRHPASGPKFFIRALSALAPVGGSSEGMDRTSLADPALCTQVLATSKSHGRGSFAAFGLCRSLTGQGTLAKSRSMGKVPRCSGARVARKPRRRSYSTKHSSAVSLSSATSQ